MWCTPSVSLRCLSSSRTVLDAVQLRFRDAALGFGRLLSLRWMGRKITFESLPT